MKSKKPLQLALTLFIAMGIVMTGAFAWSSFNQSRVNLFTELQLPDVNLHDDFAGGPNKDIYVENSGAAAAVVRVRLTEFLQTQQRGGMVRGHLRDEDKAKFWAPHTGNPVADDCRLIAPDTAADSWIIDGFAEDFHDYYLWTMANAENPTGQIYFKPATTEQKGEYGSNGAMLREPQVVSDPLTETSPYNDAHLDYAAQVRALIDNGKLENEALLELGLGKTLPSAIMTMTEWVSGSGTPGEAGYRAPYAMGDYWVIDQSDGWCYWASPLAGGTATGLLLDRVDRTEKSFDSKAEYCINVWLQAVDSSDLGQFEVAGNGGISANGKRLVELAAGRIVIAGNGDVYIDNGDGTYTVTEKADGTPVTGAKPFVGLGVAENGSPLGYTAPVESRIEIGQRVTITELLWNGSDYTNYDELSAEANNNWYNLKSTDETGALTAEGKQIYEVQGITLGVDNRYYLTLAPLAQDSEGSVEPMADKLLYIGSVIKTTQVQPVLLAAAETEAAAAITGSAYKQANPGAGPFGVIYPGDDGKPGSEDDNRLDPNITLDEHNFYHLGSGVYVEVNGAGETVSKDDPVKYYFAGKFISDATIIGVEGTTEEKINRVFPLQLTVGDKFNVTFGDAAGDPLRIPVTAYTKVSDGAYTMPELTKGVDGRYYIYLGGRKTGYIEPGTDGCLGNAQDLRRWAGNMGIGSADDGFAVPTDINESFLLAQGITDSAQLAKNRQFTADKITWSVLDIDKYGNRLVLSKTSLGKINAANPHYNGSGMETEMKKLYDEKIRDLRPYVLGAYTPVETTKWSSMTKTAEAYSGAVYSRNNASIFPLSQSEWLKYGLLRDTNKNAYVGKSMSCWTRSPGSFGTTNGSSASMNREWYEDSTNYLSDTLSAAWVRFSDAEEIATATTAEMELWKNMPVRGGVVTFGSYPQNQIAETPHQPIQWKVLDTNGTKALLIATKSLDSGKMIASETDKYSQWSTAPARTLLNNTFYNKAFSEAEKAKILTTTVRLHDMSYASDKLFLPSIQELRSYPGNLAATNTVYAEQNMELPENDWYWTRSIGSSAGLTYFVKNGTEGPAGRGYYLLGMRPMMWVDYSL